jgi:hypothetical protein
LRRKALEFRGFFAAAANERSIHACWRVRSKTITEWWNEVTNQRLDPRTVTRFVKRFQRSLPPDKQVFTYLDKPRGRAHVNIENLRELVGEADSGNDALLS